MGKLVKHNKPILIVESDSKQQERMQRDLARYVSEFPLVRCVDSASEAIEFVKSQVPACCILNYRLGEANAGFVLLRKFRKEFPAEVLPIIILADYEDEEFAVDSLQYGAQNYLLKEEITPARLYGALWTSIRSSSLQKQLSHLFHYDSLTGLLNRNLFMNRLDLAIKRCDRYSQRCALLYLNLDGFKPVNETYGHEVGDSLLQAVAERIKRNCRSTDSAARTGGDEFVVLLEHIDDQTGSRVAEKLLKALEAPFDISGQSININTSIGLATYPDTAKNMEELLKQADQALLRAKRDEATQFVCFSQRHKHQWSRQTTLEKDLPGAIARGELALAYQPIVRADNFELKRLEVLSRWPREDFAVNAFELMEMIDRLNLIEPFHEWLFHTAFSQLESWRGEGIHPEVCLNVPANYCYSPNISRVIRNSLDSHAIDPLRVELEITESTIMKNPDKSVKVLQSLHDYGLRIAVDDFGTGYSSMAYLSRLPLDTLKIDRHFFLDEKHHDRNRKIIDAITALGHSLDLDIIAEGVETQFQLTLARAVGCDLLQGFYFGKPAFAGKNWHDYMGHFQHFTVPNASVTAKGK